ncbi:MAG: DNA polymerase III, subunit gamma and tau [Betaproteobacteria bacterium RIFCSPLOWO2_02_FULL_67_26]|nr:MAG: DNA polymerase III, subunit gamma and tau [Betaproteobacteria bacterium RIFCSPLOWO2_02_FULL_67_26]
MTQVLARKWRPRTFAELVGQEHVVRALQNALAQQRLHHAYLFTGTRGVGKTTLARIVAKALNCESGVSATPCGQCPACAEIDAGRFVDLIELDAASNTQVDNMRELLESALYAPTAGRYKVYIIDEVHMLSRNAFNAMLKTLEEPPAHVTFILATTDPQKIPVTVLSRCLQFNLKQIPQQQIRGRLQHILEAESIRYEAAALPLLARAAQGSLRDALSLLDQAIAHGAGSVGEESVHAMLGVVGRDPLYAVLRALARQDGAALVAEAARMAELSLSFEAALQDLASLLHRISLAQTVPDALGDDPERAVIEELSRQVSADDLQLYYQIAIQGRADLGLAPDEHAGFTMTLLRMLAFAPAAEAAAGTVSTPAAAQRAAPAAPAAESKKNRGDASWQALVAELNLTGMARMLAEHCELVARDAARFELRIAQAHQRLLDGPYQDRLKAALESRLGAKVRLVIQLADSAGASPAAIADREKQQRQAQAIAAIEQDPFVRELVENFDGRVVESSIKPVQ